MSGVVTDWNRYLGRWWEQARVPSWFEPVYSKNVTADYSLNPDGSLKIVNAYSDDLGLRHYATARAHIDTTRPGTLRVSFFPSVESDYIVLGHGCAHPDAYDCAVVGSSDKKLLWFLTRNPSVTQSQLIAMQKIALNSGYAQTIPRLQLTPKLVNKPFFRF